MQTCRLFVGCLVCGLAALESLAAPLDQPQIIGVYTLPPIALGALQNALLPGTLAHDRRIALGSTGSDLWRDAEKPAASGGKSDQAERHQDFWMITDRGPNSHVAVAAEKRRTFPTPDFVPLLVRATLRAGAIEILQAIPLADRTGQPVNGLPNLPTDEVAYDFSGQQRLTPDPRGIDPEGMVHTSGGDFWIVEEYRPSLLHVDGRGRIIARYIPAGERLEHVEYPVIDALPAVYARRRHNRGFEGLAMSRDEQLLYLLLESPLENPDAASAARSRSGRILVFDTLSQKCSAEFIYRFESAARFRAGATQDELRACGLALVAPDRLLVIERTDEAAKIFSIDLRRATNLLSTAWHAAADEESLENVVDPAAAGIRLPEKREVVDLSIFPQVPAKIEGITIIDRRKIAVANDNDFAIGQFSPAGNNVGNNAPSKVFVIRLPTPLR